MPNYQQAKIYKIWDNNYAECYVGGTIQEFSVRMAEHRRRYKSFLDGRAKRVDTSAFKLFLKYGLENCRLELDELYPCNSKVELVKREGEHIRNSNCVNRCNAGRSHKEYNEENKEYIAERQKKYDEGRKDFRKEYQKQYHQDNKYKIQQQRKEYWERNKTKLHEKNNIVKITQRLYKEKRKETYRCQCGVTLTKSEENRHNKSLKHQQYLNSLNQEENDEAS